MSIFKRKADGLPGRRRVSESNNHEAGNQTNPFQRNRTMRGSAPYSDDTVDNGSPRARVHHLASKRRKIGLMLLVVAMSGLVIFWLLGEFTAQITIGISNADLSRTVDSKVYEKVVNNYLGVHPLSRLRFMIDKTDLTNFIIASQPEVANVTNVSSGSIGQTNIALSMRRPVAGWTINGKQYFVDDKGVAFEQNFYDNPTLQIVDDSGITPGQGQAVASNIFLSFVGRIVALSKERNYTVEQAIIPVGTTRQLEVQLKDIRSHVLFSIDRPAGEQVEDMAKALNYLISRGQSPARIDVRVSGKAFYQ